MRKFVSLFLLMIVSCSVAWAADSNELLARMKRADDLTRIDDSSLKPWHLKANFQLYDEKGSPKETGTLEEWWAGESLWEQIYTSPSYTAKLIVNKDGAFRTKGAGPVPELLKLVARQIVHPMPSAKDYQYTHPELRKQLFGKLPADCIMLDLPLKGMEVQALGVFPTYCFDRDKDSLRLSFEFGSQFVIRNSVGLFQQRSVATTFTVKPGNVVTVSAAITTLQSAELAGDDFVPDAGQEKVGDLIAATVPVSSVVMSGHLLTRAFPEYPFAEKARAIEGDVVLKATIGTDGHVHSLRVATAPDAVLAVAAYKAVRAWTYKPFLQNGVLVEVETSITVHYALR